MNTYGEIMDAMEEVERELKGLDPEWANVTSELIALRARHSLREAQLRLTFRGTGTVPEIDAMVKDALWYDHQELMERLTALEGRERAFAATFRTLDRALSSMQSRLAAVVRLEQTNYVQ
jgi:phage shock protein A